MDLDDRIAAAMYMTEVNEFVGGLVETTFRREGTVGSNVCVMAGVSDDGNEEQETFWRSSMREYGCAIAV